jgi:O-antigen/teichoic acid export membrane protein
MKLGEKFILPFKGTEVRKIFNNIANFSIFQLTNYLIPLITIPYIVRIVGTEKFGIISFIQAVIYYFFIVVDYGFDISGTQKIAQQRDSQNKLNTIFSSILIIKILLMLFSIVVLYILSIFFQEIREYYLIYIFSFLLIPAQMLLSLWFYTAMENTKYLNYVNVVNRILYLFGIFFLIKTEQDFYLIPAVHSFSLLIAGVCSIIIIYKVFNVRFKLPEIDDIIYYLKDGWYVFVSNISITLYRNSNVVILGLFASKEIVGIYSAGEKIVKVLQSIFIPINKVMYPYISREKVENPEKSLKYIKYMILFLGGTTFLISGILIVGAKPFSLLFFGNEFLRTSIVIQISVLAILFGSLNYILGIIFMLNFNMKKQFFISVFITGIINIIMCSLLCSYYYEIGAAITFVSAEIILFTLIIYYLVKEGHYFDLLKA